MASLSFRSKRWNTSGDLPAVGSRAPDFRLVDDIGDEPDDEAALRALGLDH